jgi:hypothetical protein
LVTAQGIRVDLVIPVPHSGRRNPYERADYFVSRADEKFAVTRERIRQIEAKAHRWGLITCAQYRRLAA